MGDFPGLIPGAVIDDEDIQKIDQVLLPEERGHCLAQIGLNIVGRNGYRQKFFLHSAPLRGRQAAGRR